MPYTMDLYADAGCRHNNNTPAGPIAASAVTMTNKHGHRTFLTHQLPSTPAPTMQRAQLHATILALEQARTKARQMMTTRSRADMDVTVHTASKYVLGCMTEWCWKWMRNGFRNRRGREVAHRDLIERALRLEGEVLETGGRVEWVWEPRGRVGVAYRLVSVVLDEMEPGYVDSESDAPIRTIWEKGGL